MPGIPERDADVDIDGEEAPQGQSRVMLFGVDLAQSRMAISTFAHLLVLIANLTYLESIPVSFSKGVSNISPPIGEDYVFVCKLGVYLSKIIAGDFKIHLENDQKSIFDIIKQFPLQIVDRYRFGDETKTESLFNQIKSGYQQAIDTGEVYLVSLNVLKYWLLHVTAYTDPLDTYWKFWIKKYSKQMLGEAIGFKLCLLHGMTYSALRDYGNTSFDTLEAFKTIH